MVIRISRAGLDEGRIGARSKLQSRVRLLQVAHDACADLADAIILALKLENLSAVNLELHELII